MIDKIYTVDDAEGEEILEGTVSYSEAQAVAEEAGGVVIKHTVEETAAEVVDDFTGEEGGVSEDDEEGE